MNFWNSDNDIITSLLDNDFYKFTMHQFVLHQFPSVWVRYKFKCRTDGINLAKYEEEIRRQIRSLCNVRFRKTELNYLRSNPNMSANYVEFLSYFYLKCKFVSVVKESNGELSIEVEGPWWSTMLFEVPILKIVHEVYSRNEHPEPDYSEGLKRLDDKIELIKNYGPEFKFADFGSRRAFSKRWHDTVVGILSTALPNNMIGTSNVMLARKYNITPIGTMAHEVFQACQGLSARVEDSQKYALKKWAEEYNGALGIALTDTLGMDKFLKDFDLYFTKLFDGVRQDSGDPILWCDKMINHYRRHGIDPRTKTAIFSDGLTIPKALDLCTKFSSMIKTCFGIGTNLTNDIGYKSLQIVMKLIECNGRPTAKISDTPGKTMCEDSAYLEYLREVIRR